MPFYFLERKHIPAGQGEERMIFPGGYMEQQRRGIIDIGTNSVRLLIAEKEGSGEWKTLVKKLNSSRLGEGMTDTASLSSCAMQRTLKAIKTFAEEAREDGVTDLAAYGTSIMRDAKEAGDFAKEVTKETGVPVKILSGQEEAFYSYVGAAGTASVVTAVVDIGGGSTEICMGYGTDIGYRKSFNIGCVRCSSQFDTTSARGLGELKKHCFEQFKTADEMSSVKRWVCVGGTATTVAAILQEMDEYDASKIQGYTVKEEDVSRLLKELSRMSYDERCQVKGLMPERADIIVAGVAIMDSLMEYYALDEVTVSDRDLQEGLLDQDSVKPGV